MPYTSIPCRRPPLKWPCACFRDDCLQSGRLVAILYPLGHPTPYASAFGPVQSRRRKGLPSRKTTSQPPSSLQLSWAATTAATVMATTGTALTGEFRRQAQVRHMLGMSQAWVRHRSGTGQALVGHRSGTGQAKVRHGSGTGQEQVRHRSGTGQAQVRHRLGTG
jgi:hypothetical protein